MLQWLWEFFVSKQTFASTAADAASIAAVLAAGAQGLPGAQEMIQASVPPAYAPLVPAALALGAYVGGVVSGRKTSA